MKVHWIHDENYIFAVIEIRIFTRKLYPNTLVGPAVLLAQSCWAMGYVQPWVMNEWINMINVQCGAIITQVNFLTNIHPIACLLGRDMGCLLWNQHMIDILPQLCITYVISYNDRLHYNSTRLYLLPIFQLSRFYDILKKLFFWDKHGTVTTQCIWKSCAPSTPGWSQNFQMDEWIKKIFWASNFALKPKFFAFYRNLVQMQVFLMLMLWLLPSPGHQQLRYWVYMSNWQVLVFLLVKFQLLVSNQGPEIEQKAKKIVFLPSKLAHMGLC